MGEDSPLVVDGSRGEGGGQILRTALTLSMLTGRSLRIVRIREGRPTPGLKAQHLASVQAASAICGGSVTGARIGSREVEFRPGPVRAGEYDLRIPTAGSASLVLQTVAIPLAMAAGPSEVSVSGGTHVEWSPSAHFLRWHWAHWLGRIGLGVEVTMETAGFYPKGGGRLVLRCDGGGRPRAWSAPERGSLREVRGEVTISRLSGSIGDRIAREARRHLAVMDASIDLSIREVPSKGPGVSFDLLARLDGATFATTCLGRRGLPAERLAQSCAEDLLGFLDGGAEIDRYLADQALVPLVLAPGKSRFRAAECTTHLLTNSGTIALFLGDRVRIEGKMGEEAEVTVEGGI
ncbi:MAG: RNA 3'-terminal phosphate cyclase [Planctomycetota bacterium]|nr:RNA 3'-terminal phosphate cyclase [Planctomycetota bacterium]